jgi:hypothetical protein
MSWERLGVVMVFQQHQPTQQEDRLLRAEVMQVRAVRSQTLNPGSSAVSRVMLADGAGLFDAYHKTAAGIDEPQARGYGHDPLSALINESVAWLIAKALGPPYSDFVPPVMIRSIWPNAPGLHGGAGTLALGAPGVTNDPAPLNDPAFCHPAAFFDGLIAQQDRHVTNYRWAPGRLGLIDNAYAFAAPGYLTWASSFVERRHADGHAGLTSDEMQLLGAVDGASAFWDWIGRMLRPDQAAALRGRVRRMLASAQLVAPLDF